MSFGDHSRLYNLSYEADGVYLEVFPSSEGLSKKKEIAIINYLKRKKIQNLNSKAIFEAMYAEPPRKIKIAPPQKEEPVDEDLEIRIADRGMKAYAKLIPPEGGKLLTIEDFYRLLKEHGIVYGINTQAIAKMINNRQYGKEICVAVGQKPKDGTDARLVYHFDFKKEHKPVIKEDGTVDYRHLDLITNVKKGQALVSMIPATEGKPGMTVTGQTVAARSGKSIRLPKGKNVLVSENKLELTAAIDGKVDIIDGKIHVFAIYEVPHNVDNSTGNIDFIGNVIVRGNVLTGFEVKAGGYIEVWGVVEGARLISKGDVVLKQGMQGMEKGIIESEGNVVAKFIENGTVYAKGDIIVEAIMHSTVKCGGKINVAGRKGLIVGGLVQAGTEISAKTIGSPMSTVTNVEVGIDPQLRQEYTELVNQINLLEEQRKKAEQVLRLFEKMKDYSTKDPYKIEIKRKAIKAKLNYSAQMPKIKQRIYELEQIFNNVGKGAIHVMDTIYPGTKVTIGPSSLYIKEEMRYTTFKREQGEIVSTVYLG